MVTVLELQRLCLLCSVSSAEQTYLGTRLQVWDAQVYLQLVH